MIEENSDHTSSALGVQEKFKFVANFLTLTFAKNIDIESNNWFCYY